MGILGFRAWYLTTLLVVYSFPSSCEGKNWALLVAGFYESWHSYPYQADVCHAYQVLSDHGTPDEQIVVMMYDNIAYNDRNPYPGVIIHHPDGPDVYHGVPHDYVGDDVNRDVFLAVLQGDRDRVYELTGYHGKVIDSGPDDHVFVYFSTNGVIGLMLMPSGPDILASELNDALKSMHENEKFAKLVFYLKTNNAGSMFEDLLPEDINVYAITDTNPEEGSPCTYWVNEIGYCVASVFGSIWLENCDEVDIRQETLQEHFEAISERAEEHGITPTQYGDLSFTSLALSEFLGDGECSRCSEVPARSAGFSPVTSMDQMEIFSLKQRLADPRQASRHDEIRAELEEKLWLQAQTDVFFSSLVDAAGPNKDHEWDQVKSTPVMQRSAYEYAVGQLMDACPRLRLSANTFVGARMNTLVNLINRKSLRKIMAAIDVVASTSPLCL